MALEFEKYIPAEAARADGSAPVIVLLHGRGSDRFDLQRLRSGLPAGAIVVSPEAPFPAAPWGYGPGSAWYRYLYDDIPEPTTFEQSQQLLGEFLGRLPELLGVRPAPLILGGFSQGGTMSLAHALRNPGAVPHVLNFSGFLARHPSVSVSPETVAKTRIFWGHGTRDPNIPWSMAERGRAALRAAGADLEARDYPIGHWIDPVELEHARAWIEQVLPPASDPTETAADRSASAVTVSASPPARPKGPSGPSTTPSADSSGDPSAVTSAPSAATDPSGSTHGTRADARTSDSSVAAADPSIREKE